MQLHITLERFKRSEKIEMFACSGLIMCGNNVIPDTLGLPQLIESFSGTDLC